jgi:hypothetical protein
MLSRHVRSLSTARTPAATMWRMRRLLEVKQDKVDDPARADPQVSRLHREITSRHKRAVRNHSKTAEVAAAAAAELDEEEIGASLMEARRLHVDSLRIHRAGDHIEVDMMLTGIVEAPGDVGGEERAFKKRVFPEVGFSPTMPGSTRDFELDGFLTVLRGSMHADLPEELTSKKHGSRSDSFRRSRPRAPYTR